MSITSVYPNLPTMIFDNPFTYNQTESRTPVFSCQSCVYLIKRFEKIVHFINWYSYTIVFNSKSYILTSFINFRSYRYFSTFLRNKINRILYQIGYYLLDTFRVTDYTKLSACGIISALNSICLSFVIDSNSEIFS